MGQLLGLHRPDLACGPLIAILNRFYFYFVNVSGVYWKLASINLIAPYHKLAKLQTGLILLTALIMFLILMGFN